MLRGRHDECAVLDRLVAAAREHRSGVLVLRGEAGVGKSALMEHLAARANGCRVVRIVGIQSEMELAFSGLHQLCAPMLDRLERLPAPQQDALSVAFGLDRGRAPDRFLVGLAALSLLSEFAETDGPLVCLIDDAQWLDRTSLQALAFVARRLQAESIAMVFAIREPIQENELESIPALAIGGLGREDARALLDAVVPWPLDERIKDRIVTESDGNPLALLEVCVGMTPAELELGLAQVNTTPLVSRIEARFVGQVEALPAATQRLLLLAAIDPLGEPQLLERAAASLDLSLDSAAPAQDVGLLELGPRVHFRHPLVRSAVRRAASPEDVRQAHKAVAEATDSALDPDRRAWHLAYATSSPDEAIANDLDKAAARARRRGGYAAAAALLERSLELTPSADQRGARVLATAFAKLFEADHAGGLDVIARAAQYPLTDLERGWLERLEASFTMNEDSDAGSLMLLEAAEHLQRVDGDGARGAYLGALSARMFLGRLGDPRRLVEAAEAARRASTGLDATSVTDLLLEGLAVRFTDGYDAALDRLRVGVQACEQEKHPGLHLAEWVVFVPTLPPETWDDGLWDGLTAHLVAATRDDGGLLNIPMALDYRAGFEVHAGRLDVASALVEEADAINDATRSTPCLTTVELAAWRGHERQALESITASIDFWSGRGEGRWISLGEFAKAVLFNGLGRYDLALESAQIASAHDDLGIFGWALAELIEAGVRTGRLDIAQDGLRRLEERTAAAGTNWSLGVQARAQALLVEDARAEDLYREAIERLGATRMTADLARTHLLFGEWLRRTNRRLDAQQHLRHALDALRTMGAIAFAERARLELAATGMKVQRQPTGVTAGLTPQEAQIARLAAERFTNPEIAAQLFISPRTVEYHLAKVFTKLGISSRKALPAALGRNGSASSGRAN